MIFGCGQAETCSEMKLKEGYGIKHLLMDFFSISLDIV